MIKGILLSLLFASALSALECPSSTTPTLLSDEGQFVLSNGFVCAIFDNSVPSLISLRGDFSGSGNYGKNVLGTGGVNLGGSEAASVQVLENSTSIVSIEISNLLDHEKVPNFKN